MNHSKFIFDPKKGTMRISHILKIIKNSVERNFISHNPIIDPEANVLLSNPKDREELFKAIAEMRKNSVKEQKISLGENRKEVTLSID
tara:strand:+ start:20056 stop:20319 length:264 start_codon:yes stop_codon:yes gene_type:complete